MLRQSSHEGARILPVYPGIRLRKLGAKKIHKEKKHQQYFHGIVPGFRGRILFIVFKE